MNRLKFILIYNCNFDLIVQKHFPHLGIRVLVAPSHTGNSPPMNVFNIYQLHEFHACIFIMPFHDSNVRSSGRRDDSVMFRRTDTPNIHISVGSVYVVKII